MHRNRYELPISKPNAHPIIIGLQRNDEMDAFDLNIIVGNFPTQEAALAYAKAIKEFLERDADGAFQRVS